MKDLSHFVVGLELRTLKFCLLSQVIWARSSAKLYMQFNLVRYSVLLAT